MNYFEKRRLKKWIKTVRHALRHALHMREDITAPDVIRQAHEADLALVDAVRRQDWAEAQTRVQTVQEAAERILPDRNFPKWRENIEILVVAISVAMAFRCYFIQPFKIPTGSMQPTLNGVILTPQTGKQWYDHFPINLVSLALFGDRYVEVRAKQDGTFRLHADSEGKPIYTVGNMSHPVQISTLMGNIDIAHSMAIHPHMNQRVKKGDLLASGRITMGDHIFVNKMRYNFIRPKRGDIIVFDTTYVRYPTIPPGIFYIKRLVGMENETITVSNRHLVANGQIINEPYPFRRLVEAPGYNGYVPMELLAKPGGIHVGPEQFLPFGDNTLSSLDGRFFGPVSEKALVGPAFFIYWPFSRHWGFVR